MEFSINEFYGKVTIDTSVVGKVICIGINVLIEPDSQETFLVAVYQLVLQVEITFFIFHKSNITHITIFKF